MQRVQRDRVTRLLTKEFLCALCASVAVFLCASVASAQPASAQPPAARPKVGLALGGGSARGLAHIGVLEWFEEHRIPIDVISGTSMGGLIAGAYASGHDARTRSRADARDRLGPDVRRRLAVQATRRSGASRTSATYPSQLEFGLKGGFRLPGGLNPGQQVALLLDQIALPVLGPRQLRRPAHAVPLRRHRSADGEAVVLGQGPLAQAMRATMAIPGVFTPVNYENWLLVDGGALNNIPADVAREMGASTS